MPSLSDPICALITPAGYAAINVIRISGKGSVGIVAEYFTPRRKLLSSRSHQVIHGSFHDFQGLPLDEVLCTVFRAPHSYTGEECVEISCHGNPLISARILENLLRQARHAKPGEFTLRALLNGKFDLTQAEAVNDLINATADNAETAALMQVQGVLSEHLKQILDGITAARLRCELAIDFVDQDLPQIDLEDLRNRISGLLGQARDLYGEGKRGRLIREGIRICLAGAPNSGKSSLFNAFLKQNRAIVTPLPGTTRDYLEESIALQGYTLVLYDTAGIRDSSDETEAAGIERSHELMRQADLILFLIDSTTINEDLSPPKLETGLEAKTLWLVSKADLTLDAGKIAPLLHFDPILVSVVTPGGMDNLYAAILKRFQLPRQILNRPLITNTRHLAALSRCIEALESALQALETGSGYEYIAFDLIAASHALEEILGIITTDDLLEQIFSGFCIGK